MQLRSWTAILKKNDDYMLVERLPPWTSQQVRAYLETSALCDLNEPSDSWNKEYQARINGLCETWLDSLWRYFASIKVKEPDESQKIEFERNGRIGDFEGALTRIEEVISGIHKIVQELIFFDLRSKGDLLGILKKQRDAIQNCHLENFHTKIPSNGKSKRKNPVSKSSRTISRKTLVKAIDPLVCRDLAFKYKLQDEFLKCEKKILNLQSEGRKFNKKQDKANSEEPEVSHFLLEVELLLERVFQNPCTGEIQRFYKETSRIGDAVFRKKDPGIKPSRVRSLVRRHHEKQKKEKEELANFVRKIYGVGHPGS